MNAFLDLFSAKEQSFGLPSGYLARTAEIESGFNPAAQNPNSSAGGLFQFIDSTAKQYGLKDRFDPTQATEAAARLARDNARILERGLGRPPTSGELYLAHQQGAGGALKLLRNPDAKAEDVVGSAAARLNRGGGRTAGDFANLWINKFDNAPMRVSNFPAMASAPTPPPREQMLAAREGAPMDGGLLSYASLGGAPQPAPAQAPMAFAQGGNSGGMQPQPVQMKMGDDGLPTAMQGIQASFGGGIPFAPEGGNDPMSAMMAALSQPKPLRETLGLVDELIEGFGAGGVPGSDDERRNLAGIRGTLSADTDAATARGREAASISANDFNDRFNGEPASISSDDFNDRFEGEPVGLLDLPRGNNGLFGEDPFKPSGIASLALDPMDQMTVREMPPISGGPLTMGRNIPQGQAFDPMPPDASGGIVPQEYASAPFAQPQEAAPMNQPAQAPMQPQQPPLDPNAWSGGEWIPPDIGMQLAQAQMRGGVPQADMPMQGGATAQGVPQAPQQPAQAEQLPAPPPGGMGGVAPVAQPQQTAPSQPQGEPSPMRQAFADMLGAVGQSLMETGDLRGVGKAMQGLRLASMERSKSRAEQNAIVAALRTAMPNATDEFLYTLAGDPSGRAGKIAMDAAQAAQQQALAAQAQELQSQSDRQALGVFRGDQGDGANAVPASESDMYRPEDRRQAHRLEELLATQSPSDSVKKQIEARLTEMRQRGRDSRDPESTRRIAALMARGHSQGDAEDLVYGYVKEVVDPTLGTPMLVNLRTGESRPFGANVASEQQRADSASPAPNDRRPRTLYDMSEESTGVIPALQERWTDIAPQFGAPGVDNVVENRQQFELATNEMIRALSINPRFPVAEMERLRREVDITPGMFRSGDGMRQRMRAIDAGLRVRLENEMRVVNDPQMPAEQRRNARTAANDIENFLRTMGVPDRADDRFREGAGSPSPTGDAVLVTTPEEAQALPPGTRYVTPDGEVFER
jgi:hypothetical protein